MSLFDGHDAERRFREAWESVRIERSVAYTLFTFGDSELPYFLVTQGSDRSGMVKIRQGEVRIARPRLITPENMHPEFRNFFEDEHGQQFIDFIMARSAAFGNLKITNEHGSESIVTDTVEEAVARLNRRLDSEEEDRVAILSASAEAAGMAVFRYAAERVMESADSNVTELRERGFLP